jgi:cytochrome P450
MTIDQVPLVFPFAMPPGSDPAPEFARLREHQPVTAVVLPSGDMAWLVTRYRDVRTVLSDLRFSRAAAEAPGAPRMGNTRPGPDTILGMDPPDHTRLRKLVAQAFTARSVERLRPRTMELAAGLVHGLLERPLPADLMSGFALALPMKVIFELLGVPFQDSGPLHELTEVIFSLAAHTPDEVRAARQDIEAYLRQALQRRREHPTDDLLTALVAARDHEDRLSEQEMVGFALILITVGHMSTANTLGAAIYSLLRHPRELAMLRKDPRLIPSAVEELLRYNPFTLTGAQLRVAVADTEIGGRTIRAGEGVIAAVGSANYDSSRFAQPDRLDLARADNPHLAFGFGVHHCLGAQLARMELQVALAALLDGLPATLALAVPPDELAWKTGLTAQALVSLPVVW